MMSKSASILLLVGSGALLLFAIWVNVSDKPPSASSKPVENKYLASIPPDQARFIEVVSKYKEKFGHAKNELQKSNLRDQRKDAIYDSLSEYSVSSWVGTIKEIGSNNDGKATLSVIIASNIEVTTWNNALSDIKSNTLIEKDTQIYNTLLNLRKGHPVKFSGTFFQSDKDYIEEQSMTTDGSMTNPEFLFKFESVELNN